MRTATVTVTTTATTTMTLTKTTTMMMAMTVSDHFFTSTVSSRKLIKVISQLEIFLRDAEAVGFK